MIRIKTREGSFAQHLAAYCLSGMAAKASRLFVVVAVARSMDAGAIGLAAAAIAAADILKALTENGIGQRIIAAPEDELEAACRTARQLFRLWCGGLFLLQLAVAAAMRHQAERAPGRRDGRARSPQHLCCRFRRDQRRSRTGGQPVGQTALQDGGKLSRRAVIPELTGRQVAAIDHCVALLDGPGIFFLPGPPGSQLPAPVPRPAAG
ncbi:hypothetical protein [Mangrovicoccus ximenensis]|uniref:hypothetical protein n=1 Tax=Mangrovicoccus ximenensis TaxID=1911570 RepID=UPI00191BF540|nr:hypothetical protein [Mangrovicoccus ximenensis]